MFKRLQKRGIPLQEREAFFASTDKEALSLIKKINGIWGSTMQWRKPMLGSGLPKKTKLKAVWKFARTTNNYEDAHNIVKSYMTIKKGYYTQIHLPPTERAFKDMVESRTRSPRNGSNGSSHGLSESNRSSNGSSNGFSNGSSVQRVSPRVIEFSSQFDYLSRYRLLYSGR